jgi:hypothetical protein
MKALLIVIASVAALVPALSRVDYAFYNPPRGEVSIGRARDDTSLEVREVLTFTVSREDATRLGANPTIERFADFYGTRETIACSLRRTWKSDNKVYLTRALSIGQSVSLCLD